VRLPPAAPASEAAAGSRAAAAGSSQARSTGHCGNSCAGGSPRRAAWRSSSCAATAPATSRTTCGGRQCVRRASNFQPFSYDSIRPSELVQPLPSTACPTQAERSRPKYSGDEHKAPPACSSSRSMLACAQGAAAAPLPAVPPVRRGRRAHAPARWRARRRRRPARAAARAPARSGSAAAAAAPAGSAPPSLRAGGRVTPGSAGACVQRRAARHPAASGHEQQREVPGRSDPAPCLPAGRGLADRCGMDMALHRAATKQPHRARRTPRPHARHATAAGQPQGARPPSAAAAHARPPK